MSRGSARKAVHCQSFQYLLTSLLILRLIVLEVLSLRLCDCRQCISLLHRRIAVSLLTDLLRFGL